MSTYMYTVIGKYVVIWFLDLFEMYFTIFIFLKMCSNLDEIIKVEMITFPYIYFKKIRFCFFAPANSDMLFLNFIKII